MIARDQMRSTSLSGAALRASNWKVSLIACTRVPFPTVASECKLESRPMLPDVRHAYSLRRTPVAAWNRGNLAGSLAFRRPHFNRYKLIDFLARRGRRLSAHPGHRNRACRVCELRGFNERHALGERNGQSAVEGIAGSGCVDWLHFETGYHLARRGCCDERAASAQRDDNDFDAFDEQHVGRTRA